MKKTLEFSIENYIKKLARINATTEITSDEFNERKLIVNSLEKLKIIELQDGGNFLFNEKEFQNIYLNELKEEKLKIGYDAISKLDGVYMIVTWPSSQLIMDEKWFDDECYLVDTEKDPSLGNSAFFVPVKRLNILEEKLKLIHNKKNES